MSLLLLLAAALSAAPSTPPAVPLHSAICQFGSIYKIGSGKTIIVKRFGVGINSFQSNGAGPKQAGMALDFIIANGGESGAVYGPMRSSMFPTDLSNLDRLGYRWEKPQADPGGFFRVLSDDGQHELFMFRFVGCAKPH